MRVVGVVSRSTWLAGLDMPREVQNRLADWYEG
jgi:hypothetical protein